MPVEIWDYVSDTCLTTVESEFLPRKGEEIQFDQGDWARTPSYFWYVYEVRWVRPTNIDKLFPRVYVMRRNFDKS